MGNCKGEGVVGDIKSGNYPQWVCRECGLKASRGKCFSVSTSHKGFCDVCGNTRLVTEPRDFFYPKFPQKDKVSR